MGSTQKVEMFKRIPRLPVKSYTSLIGKAIVLRNYGVMVRFHRVEMISKSVCDSMSTTNLSICNMVAYESRKETYEKVSSRCNSNRPQSVNPARKNVPKGNL